MYSTKPTANSLAQAAAVLRVLVKHECAGAAVRRDFEGQLRLDPAIEEVQIGAGDDFEHRPGAELGEQSIALPRQPLVNGLPRLAGGLS